MNRVELLEREVQNLSPEELRQFEQWLAGYSARQHWQRLMRWREEAGADLEGIKADLENLRDRSPGREVSF